MAGYELTPEEIKLFLEEAQEQLQIMEETLIALEEDPDNPALVQEIFRAAHTLKGGSATAGFDNVARLTHAMESLLDLVRQGERAMSTEIADPLFDGVDLLRRCLEAIAREGDASQVDVEFHISALEEQIYSPGEQGAAPAAGGGSGEPTGGETGEPEAAGIPETPATSGSPGTSQAPETPGTPGTSGTPGPSGGVEPDQASAAGGGGLALEVTIAPDAPMSSVRAYQVLLALEDFGMITSCEPNRETIELGGGTVAAVRATIATDAPFQAVREVILDIPDIVSVVQLQVEGASEVQGASATLDAPAAPAAPASSGTTAGAAAGAAGEAAGRPAATAPGSARQPAASSSRPADGSAGRGTPSSTLGNTIRVDVALLDNLMNLVGELVIDRTRLAQLATADMGANALKEELSGVSNSLSRITTDLQDAIMQARMMPVDMLFKKFPRMIRDLSRQLGKEIDFEMSGNETELDRSVIEQIGDPLIHLLRNAVDHGIEPAHERRQKGKSERGKVRLRAYHQENQIYIEVSDDGRGLDPEVIMRKAIDRGLLGPEEASRLSVDKILEYIFQPGFSTASAVSAVSGRGVGMDVVKRNLEKVNGTVTVTTEQGKGTTFTIKLPLTLVIVQALMVEIAGCVMAIPLSNVTEAVQVTPADVHLARGWEMIAVRGEMVPLLNPAEVWGPDWAVAAAGGRPVPVVILRSGSSPLGLKVNRLLGEQEIVIKTMGPVVGTVPGISGASILGDGRVALIIDPAGLSKAVKQTA